MTQPTLLNNLSLRYKRAGVYLLLTFGIGIIVSGPFTISVMIGAFFMEYFLLSVIIGCGISTVLVALAGLLLFKFLSPKQKLDQVFTALGLQRTGFGVSNFRYTGKWRERDVQVCFSQGPLLEIFFSTASQGNVYIQNKIAKTDQFQQWQLKILTKNLSRFDLNEKLQAQAADQNWAKKIWQQSGLAELTAQLLTPVGSALKQGLSLVPNQLMWTSYGNSNVVKYNINRAEIEKIFGLLEQWLKIVESQPQPEKAIVLNKFEQAYYYHRANLVTKIRLYVILGFILLTIFITALTLGMIYFLG